MTKKTAFLIFFVIAVFYIGIIYSALPHGIRYFVLHAQGEVYEPMVCSGADVLRGYGSHYRDIVDGRMIIREIDTYEHKDGPVLWPLLPSVVLAPFFLPFFLLINALTKNRFFSLFFSFWLLVQASLILYIFPSDLVELKVLI